jgi:hypothetical protein
MKNQILFLSIAFFAITTAKAQIGVGTASPNSTLDVRGSLSTSFRTFTTTTSAAISDNMLVFTGTAVATLTLPDATACAGRAYWVKSTSTNASTLTIATTSSQTIDGLTTWTITQTNKAVKVVSNGVNWLVAAESLPGNGTSWVAGGNGVTSAQNIGTTSNFDLPFITNNTEKMRLTATGSLGIGTTTFNGTFPERLLADAGSTGNTDFQNVIVGKGNTNSYAQLNIQNTNAGTGASSDVVATADNGNESVNYLDMGINSSANTTTGILSGINTAYFYSTGGDFVIGNGTAAKPIRFFTGALASATEKLRIDGSGTTSTISMTGSISVGSVRSGTGAYTVLSSDYVVINTGVAATWTLPAASTCTGRIYRLLNHGTGSITLTPAVSISSAGTSTTLVVTAGSNFYEIISDGTVWRRIN